ncbi:retinol dehydrogenase 12 [Nemania sp. FL0031]|nr:retinol dehydrogenase 12 [Nemania sp. FL0031]
MSPPNFSVTPEARASGRAFLRRQFVSKPPITSRKDVDLAGKTAIVTGSNSGIGLECCRQLLALGLSKLIVAVRSEAKGDTAKGTLKREHPSAEIEVWKLDLSANDSILAFVERTKTLSRLDIVVHNAGMVLASQQHNSTTGHDEVIQVNYLATALLTVLLLPVLKSKNPSGSGRLVIVSSDVASWAQFKEKDSVPLLPAFDKKDSFDAQDRYYTSKLLGQLFLSELAKRVPASYGVIVNLANPGLCHGSGLNRDSNGTIPGFIFGVFKQIIGYSCAVGARQLTDAAVKHSVESHGQYLEEGKVLPMAPLVYTDKGKKIAELLWKETMEEFSFIHLEDIVKGISI